MKSEDIYITSIEYEDIEQLREWRNQPNFRKYFRENFVLSKKDQKNWYENIVLQKKNCLMFAIRKNLDESLVGCCGLVYIDNVNKSADISLYIGAENIYIDSNKKNGMAKQAALLILKYGFNILNLHRIWTEIYNFDKKKIKLYKSIGMKLDGTLRKSVYHNGKYFNSFILSILKTEYKNVYSRKFKDN